ncbi:MAG: ECF transporter S component [Bacillota bacterium]|nr:ECF transporter S component [Bacillota bacterium]
MNKKIQWITRTAIFIALLIVFQAVTKSFGQYVTGSLVNLILIVGGLTAGLSSGLTVALISPVFAYFLGISPQPFLIPFIMIGNMTIVIITTIILNKSLKNSGGKRYGIQISGIVLGAIAKFIVLYLGVVKLLPALVSLKPKQLQTLSVMFSYPQLLTALIGGFIALLIFPAIKKAVNK